MGEMSERGETSIRKASRKAGRVGIMCRLSLG